MSDADWSSVRSSNLVSDADCRRREGLSDGYSEKEKRKNFGEKKILTSKSPKCAARLSAHFSCFQSAHLTECPPICYCLFRTHTLGTYQKGQNVCVGVGV